MQKAQLEEILADKRAEVAKLNTSLLRNVRPSTRSLGYCIGTGRQTLAIWAHIMRRDAYDGVVRPDLDLVSTATQFQDLGIAALVVSTEARHWGGSRDDLVALDRSAQVPLVRHDYIVEELQLYESRRAGADAVVLHPGLVAPDVLQSFVRVLASMHMVAVALVHDRPELDRALEVEAPVVAISNRDPETGAVDLGVTVALAPLVPPSRSVVSCVGIHSREDLARLRGLVDAVCLGAALLRAADPHEYLRQLAG
jgi:indole-3-glycerol phosphate synthase